MTLNCALLQSKKIEQNGDDQLKCV